MSFKYNEKFLKYIKEFAKIGANAKLFPKVCRTCGREYLSFPEYIHNTIPTAHCLEPYHDTQDAMRTLQYRNCLCGSTLVITLTEDTFPMLDSFWEMLGLESKHSGRPLREVVGEFREQCNRYVIETTEKSVD